MGKNFLRAICLILLAALDLTALTMRGQDDDCGWFRDALKTVPNRNISIRSGRHLSLFDGKFYDGCELRFETTEALLSEQRVPVLEAIEGTELYRLGWRADLSIGADGPGTRLSAVRKENSVCLVSESQPAYLNDAGEIVQDDELKIVVQCHHSEPETD